MLPQSEIDDICRQSFEKIWKFHHTEKQNWENRIFGTYEKLSNKNKSFSEYVDSFDFYHCIDDMYHNDYSRKQFEKKIKKKLGTFKKYEFYFMIPGTFNFTTNLKLGVCTCMEFKDLRKKVQKEILDWWEAHPFNREYKEDKAHRINLLKQNLCLRFDVETIGFSRALTNAEQVIDLNLNILRLVYEGNIQSSLGVVYVPKGKFTAGAYGDWEHTRGLKDFPWLGRYDKIYADKIAALSKIFQEESISDLKQRVKQATVMFGYSLDLKKFPIRLILLCSGLEFLVVAEKEKIGERISDRIPDLLEEKNKTAMKGKLRKLYRKRSRVVHSKLSDTITKQDIKICQEYLSYSIERVLKYIQEGYSTLAPKKGEKSLMKNFNWKIYHKSNNNS